MSVGEREVYMHQAEVDEAGQEVFLSLFGNAVSFYWPRTSSIVR
jgi:hypothetical protein